MIVLRCPYCHEHRTEEELTYGGEAGVARPSPSASDAEWTNYLFMRANPKGVNHELWCCSSGCGQWFFVIRHTVTHEVSEERRLDNPLLNPVPENPSHTRLSSSGPHEHIDAESASRGYRP